MNLKFFLISMTVVAVVSDTMLHPFYPQFFASAFGMTDARHVGLYIAACCFTVMLAFPFWALVAKRVPALQLLVYTQLAAGLLSILLGYGSDSLLEFWLAALSMLAFKSSYLLIYPYVMSLERKEQHIGTIGLLAVIVHFGAILGSLLGGLALEVLEPRQVFFVMAGGDFVQTLICLFLLRHGSFDRQRQAPAPEPVPRQATDILPKGFLYKLGAVMLIFYFSAYLSRPFFSLYWESISAFDSKIASGIVFAIPGVVALFALWLNKRTGKQGSAYHGVVAAVLLGICGLLLQASRQEAVVLVGQCVFGWALFQSTVRLDLLLFELSTPTSYATDFSKILFFQNLGVLMSSFAAGSLVDAYGLQIPFIAAALGFMLTAVLYRRLFSAEEVGDEPHGDVVNTVTGPEERGMSANDVVFSKPVPRVGNFHLRALRIPQDMAVVHDWVNRAYAKYWGMVGHSVAEVESAYVEIARHAQVFLGFHNDKPAFLLERYCAMQDPVGRHYDVQPGDYGMHILVAPAQRRISNFTWHVFTAVMDFMFSDAAVERVVVEPDVRNEKIHVLNKRAGFEYQKIIELPRKTAHLAFCTRDQYAAALK